MAIISRKEWGARSPRSRVTTTWDRRIEFVVHHSEGPTTQTPRQIQNFHMDSRGWSDVGYNFLVDEDGRIYEGRGWLVIGAHAHSHNTSGIGVCFIGRDGDDVTDKAKASIRWLYDVACRHAGRTLAKRGHGELSHNSTSCPGRTLQRWVDAGMPVVGAPVRPPAKPSTPPAFKRTLRQPPLMRGEDVETWQRRMRARGWRIDVDGWYGPASESVCRAFQKDKRLKVTGDVDRKTWDAAWTAKVT